MSRTEIWLERPEFFCDQMDTVSDAIRKIVFNRARVVLVIDRGQLLGSVSEGDIVKALSRGVELDAQLWRVMNSSVLSLREHNLGEALRIIRKSGATLLPVIDSKNRVEALVTLDEVLEAATVD